MPAYTTDRHFSPECYQTPKVSYAAAGPRANEHPFPPARVAAQTAHGQVLEMGDLGPIFLTQLII